MSDRELREPWLRLGADHAPTFENEARAEVAPGHALYGLGLRAVAKCEGCDDVVFRASDNTFAIVHLTWTGKPEAPPWPLATRLGGFVAAETALDQHEH
ncbi:hypothetical protein FB474_1493 [Oryzihumus leptocrescens]|uniref:Uncharacterized protein n=1 Tax=Oryzihumus leptocrescens TaxID=297536 RepID=A0A542ZIE4_9MICO|nr:hypothetical protein FB474_1493 [Oryzihumus leptocrescens]